MKTRTMICAAGALATLAGAAQADVVSATGLSLSGTEIAQATAPGEGFKLADLTNIRHFGVQGAMVNKVIKLDIGAGNFDVVGLAWDLNSWAFTPTALGELHFAIVNSSGDGVVFTPYAGNGATGAGSTAGSVDLSAMGLDFEVTDGMIFIELYADANNLAGPEGSHSAEDYLQIEVVPAPGSLALMGLGGLAIARRRRR